MDQGTPYRQARVSAAPFASDFEASQGEEGVDRSRLITTFRAYLEANDLEADWDSVQRASNETLVNALSMMSPYGPREKQALLEAEDLKTRAEVLIAITEMVLARSGTDDSGPRCSREGDGWQTNRPRHGRSIPSSSRSSSVR